MEKLLKGLVVIETKDFAPYIHDLSKLAKATKIDFAKDDFENLKVISEFNVRARYGDIKLSFYKTCTKRYTEKYFSISDKLRLWLKRKYPKK